MRFLLGLAGAAAAICLAAPAHADVNNDQDFLTDLRDAGITYQNGDNAITIGKSVCELLDDGQSSAEIVTQLRNQNPAFQGASAAKFTYLSAAHYCPKYVTGEGRGPKPDGQPGN
ncbi:hypothetical protein HMPREF0591_6435 [Mycobacterium parascrofulaceum ATCC BAA-614]|jgi:hypothetical protein|uniref:DUF732 domain-containing protein n=1 Tax=Mycobacterium parascrofulaceum ATCC BAA-614 TaxID=525368 RepID=D5PJU1_9MYCO|nr:MULTISPECIES: DUF732 domain-containing protein [Mycobacterium]EFG73654.1 hypothetical protein HMPREF0591_6435 [Mycobacterium parascrofulaceum ATCC BAA-614]OCB46082.1 hypothetical protein A9X02_14010 [Mycobacterium malmoense]